MTTINKPATAAAPMAALTEAAEFLMCAVRAMAWGADADSREVRQSVEWATAKMQEAQIQQPH